MRSKLAHWITRVSPEIQAAVEEHIDAANQSGNDPINRSDLVRLAVCRLIGREDLLSTIPPAHRPTLEQASHAAGKASAKPGRGRPKKVAK